MKVFYRLTSIPSTNPSPVYQDNKDKLNEICLKSFVDAYKDIQPNVTFLCDHCPDYYKKMIEDHCPFTKQIIFTTIGINGTAVHQFDLAMETKDETILFQECDYVYREEIGENMEMAIQELGMVSPYDHKNFYIDKTIHSDISVVKLVNDVHYRSTERNTMTWGMQTKIFKETYHIWRKYGYLDAENWKEMREHGYMLFVPMPSFATHMASDWLAPSLDWEMLWKKHEQDVWFMTGYE